MAASAPLVCWKCGEKLPDSDLPIGRNDTCNLCHAEQHVCMMCEFYDPQVSDSCREPIADRVNDKERANFCGYFQAKPCAYQAADTHAQTAALAQLSALFGEEEKAKQDDNLTEEQTISANEEAKQKLNNLFSSD